MKSILLRNIARILRILPAFISSISAASKGIAVWLGIILLPSCSSFFTENLHDTPTSNFDFVWNQFDKTYSHFDIKKINWDSIYSIYRPSVNDQLSAEQLFSVLRNMLETLQDGHVSLKSPFSEYRHDYSSDAPTNFVDLLTITNSLENYKYNNNVGYGKIRDKAIVYIFIASWSGPKSDYEIIDKILADFKDVEGLIVDVRNNSGGSSNNADVVLSRFSTEKRLAGYVRWRNGPGHSDFGDYIPHYITPAHNSFSMPVVVLTNRKCYSSNEYFIKSMKTLHQVTTVGDSTGGGSANPIYRFLPNGWIISIPRWIEYDASKKTFEDLGLVPDILETISGEDLTNKNDRILKTAIQLLSP